jgi:hypothetical protein
MYKKKSVSEVLNSQLNNLDNKPTAANNRFGKKLTDKTQHQLLFRYSAFVPSWTL